MQLDRRKQTLLQTIVVTYVNRAEPIGSRFLAGQEGLGVRSATIRNELAEMTDLGYLRQPHTSAGRIPSDLGYRYYVDHLMAWEPLSPGDARAIRGAQRLSEGDLEHLLVQTCRVLSSLTRYTSIASPPTSREPEVRQVHLVQLTPRRLLAVAVLDNGQVTHRFCELAENLVPSAVTEISGFLDESLRDRAVSAVAGALAVPDRMARHEDAIRSVHAAIARGLADERAELYVDGASHILEHPEFRETDRVEPLVRFLEERRTAYETLRQWIERESLTVSIGQENPHRALREVSLVTARYSAGPRRSGWLGVLGPTRMHYGHAISAVRYAARALTETLSRYDAG